MVITEGIMLNKEETINQLKALQPILHTRNHYGFNIIKIFTKRVKSIISQSEYAENLVYLYPIHGFQKGDFAQKADEFIIKAISEVENNVPLSPIHMKKEITERCRIINDD